jgi:hypothetical protein
VSTAPTTGAASAFTRTQVLSWVTPTLDNGFSFVSSVPADASAAQLASDSRPLHTAASVSLHDLSEVPWTGSLQPDEQTLVKALEHIDAVTMTMPGSAYLESLDSDISNAKSALRTLSQAVNG